MKTTPIFDNFINRWAGAMSYEGVNVICTKHEKFSENITQNLMIIVGFFRQIV